MLSISFKNITLFHFRISRLYVFYADYPFPQGDIKHFEIDRFQPQSEYFQAIPCHRSLYSIPLNAKINFGCIYHRVKEMKLQGFVLTYFLCSCSFGSQVDSILWQQYVFTFLQLTLCPM